MTQNLREEFDHYMEELSEPDNLNLPAYLSGFRLIACLQDNPQKKAFVLQSGDGRKIFCKYANENFLPMLKTESDRLQIGKVPFVPYMIDYCETADGAFLLREYIEGRTLREIVEEDGPLPLKDAVSIIKKICLALSYFHNMEPPVIHRDIKPANVVLSNEGDCYFIDMGTMRRYQEGASTDTVCMGTMDFAAPEQFGARQSDQRTDIYSIGILFYYLLTGRHKLQSDSLNMFSKKVASLIRKCTAFNPDDRYDNIRQLEAALDNLTVDKNLMHWKIGTAAASILFLAVLLVLLLPKLGRGKREVVFSSALLEQAVHEELNIPNGEPVLHRDLSRISRLSICGNTIFRDKSVHNYYYHPHLINGEEALIGDISDLSILAEMTNLHYLGLDYQNISDLSPLRDLPLVSVSLAGNPLSDLSPLAGSETLTELDIAETYVYSLDALKDCPRLSSLTCAYSSVISLEPLAGLPLEKLDILDIPAKDYTVLENLPLTELRCQNISFKDALPHFEKMPKLQSLTVIGSYVTSLEPFSGIQSLKSLDLYANSIHDFDDGYLLTNVSSLCVGNNPITDTKGLASMPALTDLSVHHSAIHDFSFLNDLPGLNILQVSENQVANVRRAVPQPWFEIIVQ